MAKSKKAVPKEKPKYGNPHERVPLDKLVSAFWDLHQEDAVEKRGKFAERRTHDYKQEGIEYLKDSFDVTDEGAPKQLKLKDTDELSAQGHAEAMLHRVYVAHVRRRDGDEDPFKTEEIGITQSKEIKEETTRAMT